MRHPFFYALTRLQTRRAMRHAGYSLWQINDLMDACEDDLIDVAAAEVGAVPPLPVGAPGDRPIIDAILEFLRSEQGQALIAALVKLLLTLIAV